MEIGTSTTRRFHRRWPKMFTFLVILGVFIFIGIYGYVIFYGTAHLPVAAK